MKPLTPCLWFDDCAEEAVNFYGRIFKRFKITGIERYTKAGQDVHKHKEGAVMTVTFEMNGQPFMALNGGPLFKFTEAISFQILCDTQAEIDHYWKGLGKGADPKAQQCGWLKDKFGVSWQIIPAALPQLLKSSDPAVPQRVMKVVMKSKKFNIAALKRARKG